MNNYIGWNPRKFNPANFSPFTVCYSIPMYDVCIYFVASLVTMSASHHPTQVIPSMNTMPPAEATVCTDQNNSSYYPAFPVQK